MSYLILRPNPVTVEVAPVTRGRFVATVEDDGRTRVRDRYVISAPVAGLLRLQARAGDQVSAEQVVATILPSLPSCSTRERAVKPESVSERQKRSCRKPHRRLSV
jgi:HlyD family secretion protein